MIQTLSFTGSGPLFDRVGEGSRLADEGAERALANQTEQWREAAFAAIEGFALIGGEFNADDVREFIGDPPGHPNAWGGLFRRALAQGLIEPVGRRHTRKASAHARSVVVYRGRV